MELEWTDPPVYPKGQRWQTEMAYDTAVEQLKKHPGQWARVRRASRDKNQYPLKRRGCEVKRHQVSMGRWDIYARWPEEDQ